MKFKYAIYIMLCVIGVLCTCFGALVLLALAVSMVPVIVFDATVNYHNFMTLLVFGLLCAAVGIPLFIYCYRNESKYRLENTNET